MKRMLMVLLCALGLGAPAMANCWVVIPAGPSTVTNGTIENSNYPMATIYLFSTLFSPQNPNHPAYYTVESTNHRLIPSHTSGYTSYAVPRALTVSAYTYGMHLYQGQTANITGYIRIRNCSGSVVSSHYFNITVHDDGEDPEFPDRLEPEDPPY